MKNHYEILGVSPNCSQAEIKKAYRLLAVQYHPDKNNGDKRSEDIFKRILESYIILSDEDTRIEYDYYKGFKTVRDVLRKKSGRPSPVKYLKQFKKIKEAIFNAGCNINKEALYKYIDKLLSDENISYLIKEQDISINNLIIDEVLTCSVFISKPHQADIHNKLLILANGNLRMINRINHFNADHITNNKVNDTTSENNETQPSLTTVFIFSLLLLLFVVLLFMINN